MIISASRRTDIPAFYFPWFIKRLQEGYVMVRNPMNYHQVSRIKLNPEVVDCIVFWTKNPAPMLDQLDLLKDYHYYFQFTLTPYDQNIERNLPPKEEIINTFQKLSTQVSRERIIWRYDPIFFTDRYTKDYHLQRLTYLAEKLAGYTERCVISLLDIYKKTKRNMESINLIELEAGHIIELAEKMQKTASKHGIQVESCAEQRLEETGVRPGKCIDDRLISRIIGADLNVDRDKHQRQACGCVSSIDIGAYNTCKHGCLYCYANYSDKQVVNNLNKINVNSPILLGKLEDGDQIYNRQMKSLKKSPSLFD